MEVSNDQLYTADGCAPCSNVRYLNLTRAAIPRVLQPALDVLRTTANTSFAMLCFMLRKLCKLQKQRKLIWEGLRATVTRAVHLSYARRRCCISLRRQQPPCVGSHPLMGTQKLLLPVHNV